MLFVTVAGVPPQEKEFDSYSFPGKVISFYPPCFAPGETDESMEQNLGTISMANTVGLIDKIVSNNGNRVIFVYHSFGGSIVANYCSKHHKKVFGLVSLGGPSISFYPILKDFARSLYSIEGITD